MTVRELIEALRAMPQDAEVATIGGEDGEILFTVEGPKRFADVLPPSLYFEPCEDFSRRGVDLASLVVIE